MPGDERPYIELRFVQRGDTVTVTPRGSRGEYPSSYDLRHGASDLSALRQDVGRAAQAHQPLPEEAARKARDLYADVYSGKVADLLAAYRQIAGDEPISIRLVMDDVDLQAVPWEILCEPGTQEGFAAVSERLRMLRVVTDAEPFQPCDVSGRVRVLLLAAEDEGVVAAVRTALKEAVENGAIEWLDPLVGEDVAPANLRTSLLARSRPDRSPHILHVIGHGNVTRDGKRPILELPGSTGDITISAESLAQDLAELFGNTLRLIALDACRSASPGAAGSAASILAQRAAGAVVAHLWKVRTDVAAAGSKSLYTSLTRWGQRSGDVAASLNGARRELLRGTGELPGGAGAFSPVLYLRGGTPSLFDFSYRIKLPVPGSDAQPQPVDGVLERTLAGRFSLLLGDLGDNPSEWRAMLQRKIEERLDPNGETRLPSLDVAIQRYALAQGRPALADLFQRVFRELLRAESSPLSPFVRGLAAALQPGVHVTLHWLPELELALARHHPDSDIYVVQPPMPDQGGASLWVMRRSAGAQDWVEPDDLQEGWPEDLDFKKDFVVLRPYGGYLTRNDVKGAILTEEDHALNPRSETEMPPDWSSLVHQLRKCPTLVVGLSALDWRHRLVLLLLFDQMLPPKSLVVLPPDAEPFERQVWEKRGGGLAQGAKRPVSVACLNAEGLAARAERVRSSRA